MSADLYRLPAAYGLIAGIRDAVAFLGDIAGTVDLAASPNLAMVDAAASATELLRQLCDTLWRAGQDEHRSGMGTADSDYDAPLWCKGR